MKKLLVLFLACVLTFQYPSLSWANSPSPQAQAVIRLIDLGLEENYTAILSQSKLLSESEREFLFSLKQKDPRVPFILNLFPFFGLGSFLSGDIDGGLVQLLGEVGGLAIGTWGSTLLSAFKPEVFSPEVLPASKQNLDSLYLWMILLGYASLIGFHIYGFTQPFRFSADYNEKLKTALTGESLSWQPFVSENGIGIRLAF